MASINSLMGSSSSTSSIYGNSNVISGLASGMDTEAMIENAVSGIKTKLEDYNKDRTKLEWEQEAYRSIIDKIVAFSDKYTPKFADSSTDLLSAAFFRNATKVSTIGANKDLISAVGDTESDIKITAATMATHASYAGINNALNLTNGTATTMKEILGDNFDFAANGKITIVNGSKSAEIEIKADDTIASVLSRINGSKAGVNATYSETTGEFFIKSKETGTGSISFTGDAATALFGTTGRSVTGEKATVSMVVNGKSINKEYATNQIPVDGLIINLKGDIPAGGEGVSFSTSVDSEKIVNAIKSMVEEFNTMANEIKDAYTTKPVTNSKGKRYEPLSEEDSKDMSETAIKKHEEKAKTGLLFADSDLSALYNELRTAANALGYAGIGLTTEYDMGSGKTTLKLDEEKLRSVLDSDPDKVKDVFVNGTTIKTAGGEKTVNGMQMMQDTVQKYARTVGEKGILIKLAGSVKAPASLEDNIYKTKMNQMNEMIKQWEDKLAKKIDFYAKQFTRLEKLISDMNSQSSALMGFMGY